MGHLRMDKSSSQDYYHLAIWDYMYFEEAESSLPGTPHYHVQSKYVCMYPDQHVHLYIKSVPYYIPQLILIDW